MRHWFVTPDLGVLAKNSFSLRSTPQDIAVEFLGQIILICSQMWRDKTLRKRLAQLSIWNTVCVVVCVTLYFMPSPPGLDTKQTRGNNSLNKEKSFSDLRKSTCGDFRVTKYLVWTLRKWQKDITNHLKYELIFVRAGLFVCVRHNWSLFGLPLARDWSPLRTCQYLFLLGARKS